MKPDPDHPGTGEVHKLDVASICPNRGANQLQKASNFSDRLLAEFPRFQGPMALILSNGVSHGPRCRRLRVLAGVGPHQVDRSELAVRSAWNSRRPAGGLARWGPMGRATAHRSRDRLPAPGAFGPRASVAPACVPAGFVIAPSPRRALATSAPKCDTFPSRVVFSE